ncbi:MAG TPA: hypothetical protein ENN73_03785 [Firmicutes bacterium]|nr:hypothetical protein [Bacillota bacterium]
MFRKRGDFFIYNHLFHLDKQIYFLLFVWVIILGFMIFLVLKSLPYLELLEKTNIVAYIGWGNSLAVNVFLIVSIPLFILSGNYFRVKISDSEFGISRIARFMNSKINLNSIQSIHMIQSAVGIKNIHMVFIKSEKYHFILIKTYSSEKAHRFANELSKILNKEITLI